MTEQWYILFCEDPYQKNRVDDAFADQFVEAKAHGFETLLFSFEDLTSADRRSAATKRIPASDQLANVIYRGWMLTPAQYAALYDDLLSKNFKLLNTVTEYQNCHYLPDSLRFIEGNTPKSVFEKFENEESMERLVEKSTVFGRKPVVLKDYVKSEKHDWETACFVPDVSDTAQLSQTIGRLVELRDKYLNEGIVIREFVELKPLKIHSKSGMPLTEEYRLFFCNKKLVGLYDYWAEGEYRHAKPDTAAFEAIAKGVESNFFSMDIARLKNGELIIIELGDGQVAGLPDSAARNEFYERLKDCCR